jgi:hypothetical protein
MLDCHIVGQQDAKRAVAVALRMRFQPLVWPASQTGGLWLCCVSLSTPGISHKTGLLLPHTKILGVQNRLFRIPQSFQTPKCRSVLPYKQLK